MVLPLVEDLPVVGPVSGDHLRRFVLAMAEATAPTDGTVQAIPPRARRGRPPRNAYVACEVAYMTDVEGRAPFTPPPSPEGIEEDGPTIVVSTPEVDRPGEVTTQRAYLNPGPNLRWEPEAAQEDRWRCRGLHRWRQDGRAMLAALGAEPWCPPHV